jgi:hypothetical protein
MRGHTMAPAGCILNPCNGAITAVLSEDQLGSTLNAAVTEASSINVPTHTSYACQDPGTKPKAQVPTSTPLPANPYLGSINAANPATHTDTPLLFSPLCFLPPSLPPLTLSHPTPTPSLLPLSLHSRPGKATRHTNLHPQLCRVR